MEGPLKSSYAGREAGKLAWLAGVIWTAAVFGSLAVGLHQQNLNMLRHAESDAGIIADMDISFRNWIIGQGAVYVAATKTSPPDAALRAPDKAVKTPSGLGLMRVSHAYIMRHLSGTRERQGLPHTRIRAIAPMNQASAPTEWERSALSGFERGKKEDFFLTEGASVKYIRAFRADKSCLPCHASAQDRGGLHGGISVEVPLAPYRRIGGGLRLYWILGHIFIWLTGLLGLWISYNHLHRAQERLLKSEDRYRNLFESSRDALMTLAPPSWKFTAGNSATQAMFHARDEAEFVSNGPQMLSPERQPDGRLSSEKALEMIKTAMSRGNNFFEWTHRRTNGDDFPAEVLLTRMESEDGAFLQATVRDITERKKEQAQREALLAELKETLAHVKYLSGLIPICASCKKIRNKDGGWQSVEQYVTEHSDAKFSHGVCPDCGKRLYGELYGDGPPEEKKPG